MARTRTFIVTPVFTGAAYSAGDNIGGLQSILDFVRETRSGFIYSLEVMDTSGQKPALKIALFRSQPVGTFTDNDPVPAATSYPPSTMKKVLEVATADYKTWQGNVSIAPVTIAHPIDIQLADTTFYFDIQATGTPTLVTGCLTFVWGVSQD